MAALAELFLVLAGFDTNLGSRQFQHTAEYDIFERAHGFGQRFAVLRDACETREDVIASTIQECVVQRYIEELANLETETLAQLSRAAQLPLGDALFQSAEIMDRSVSCWERRFEFSLRLLTQLDPQSAAVVQSIEEVAHAARAHAGIADVHELCLKCAEALDRQWLGGLKVALTTFGDSSGHANAFSAHPVLAGTRGPHLLADAITSVQHLSTEGPEGLNGPRIQLLDVADENARIVDSVNVPITAQQLVAALDRVRHNILAIVRDQILHTKKVDAMLVFLRDILLFGSSTFVDEFLAARNDSSLALDRMRAADPVFASDVYDHVDSMIQFESSAAMLDVRWPLALLFSAEQCTVYCSIHSALAGVVVALASLGPGQGAVLHAYRLFLGMLWSEFQNSIDLAFTQLRNTIAADQDLSVQPTHSRVLKELVKSMCLDSSGIRARLQMVVEHALARSETVKPVNDLAVALSEHAFGRNLQLQPFLDLEGP